MFHVEQSLFAMTAVCSTWNNELRAQAWFHVEPWCAETECSTWNNHLVSGVWARSEPVL